MQYYVISISTCHLETPSKHHFNGCVIIHHTNVPSFPFSLLSLLSVLLSACWQVAWIQIKAPPPLPRQAHCMPSPPGSLERAGSQGLAREPSRWHMHLGTRGLASCFHLGIQSYTPESLTNRVVWWSLPAGHLGSMGKTQPEGPEWQCAWHGAPAGLLV